MRQSKEYSKNVDIGILRSKGYSTVHKFAKKNLKEGFFVADIFVALCTSEMTSIKNIFTNNLRLINL